MLTCDQLSIFFSDFSWISFGLKPTAGSVANWRERYLLGSDISSALLRESFLARNFHFLTWSFGNIKKKETIMLLVLHCLPLLRSILKNRSFILQQIEFFVTVEFERMPHISCFGSKNF